MGTSRLIVKNLPKTATDSKLREFFEAKGRVTDVQLKYTPDGRFRHFGFVGFKTDEEAETARSYFNNTYFGGAKIIVQACANLGDPNKPKAWSKYAVEKRDSKQAKQKFESDDDGEPKAKKKKTEEEILEKCKEDPELVEFLESHLKKSSWGNDSVIQNLESELLRSGKKSKHDVKKTKSGELEVKSGDEGGKEETKAENTVDIKKSKSDQKKVMPEVEFYTLKLRNLPSKAKKKDLKKFFAPVSLKSIRIPPGIRGIAYVGFKDEKEMQKALAKDQNLLFQNKVSVKRFFSNKEAEKQAELKRNRWAEQQSQLEAESETIGESGRIFLRNLSYETTEDDIKEKFEKYGPVTEIHLPIDKISRQLKGFGFISFLLPEHAAKAYAELDGTVLHGRMLHLLPAKVKEEAHEASEDAGSSYKKSKELQRKKSAGVSHNWNSLFLGQNAVAEIISDKYDVRKDEFLLDRSDEVDKNTASVGVRMALAETELVAETKSFLEGHGVCLEAFTTTNAKIQRSTTCMLAKNLPPKTTVVELKEVFCKYGAISRMVMPPYGITAIIEFEEPAEARAAFKKLAYSKFKNLPLYLEWAPLNVFAQPKTEAEKQILEPQTSKQEHTPSANENPPEQPKIEVDTAKEEVSEEDMVPEPDTTLFVKNLNFSTTEEKLRKHFEESGRVYSVTVAKKKDPTNPSRQLSMGFGFVQFFKTSDASNALKYQQNSMLENHLLELKKSSRTLYAGGTSQEQKKLNEEKVGTKLLVRNVPFLASKEEVVQLFKPFGGLKAVRLPMKADGSGEHRGFCFIEYHMAPDAKRAIDTMSKSTHLYGRRLVVEWASTVDTVDDLRMKTAKKFDAQARGAMDAKKTKAKTMLKQFEASQRPKTKGSDSEDEDE